MTRPNEPAGRRRLPTPVRVERDQPSNRTPPVWVDPFLAALARTGNVWVSAEVAGVDVTNVYNRRTRYAEFAEAWARVLREREERAGGIEGATPLTLPPLCGGPLPLPQGERGFELVPRTTATGAKLARPGRSRWSEAAQERFLVELGISANVKRSARAAGFSQEACYKRRLKDRHFAAGWDAALELGKARVRGYLFEAADRTFDPEALPVGEGSADLPRVTIGEAIHIARLKGPGEEKKAGPGRGWQGCEEQEAEAEAYEAETGEARERIVARLTRLRENMERKEAEQKEQRLAAGWSWCDIHEVLVPPGWIRAVEEVTLLPSQVREEATEEVSEGRRGPSCLAL